MRFKATYRFVLLGCFLFFATKGQAQSVYEVLVLLQPHQSFVNISREVLSWNQNTSEKIETTEQVTNSMNIWKASFETSLPKEVFMQRLRNINGVIAAQFNEKVYLRGEVLANDILFNQQWNLRNVGQVGGKPGADCKASFAWSLPWKNTTAAGDTIVVAVIDDMFDTIIREINWFRNRADVPGNGIDDDANGYIDDHYGWNTLSNDGNVQINSTANYHGSHVAGIIGAYGNNDTGMAGIQWGVKILPIVGANVSDVSDIIQAYNYVIDQKKMYLSSGGTKGAYIVATNSSFGIDNQFAVDQPIWCAMYDSMGKYGIISSAATTNAMSDVDVTGDIPSTCASEFLIMVSSSNFMDQHTTRGYGKYSIDIHAPGENIYSTNPANLFSAKSGTSFASPHAAAAISFLFGVAGNKWITQYSSNMAARCLDIKQTILKGVDTIAGLANKNLTSGRLNLYKAGQLIMQKDSVVSEVKGELMDADKLIVSNGQLYLEPNMQTVKILLTDISGQLIKTWNPQGEMRILWDKEFCVQGIYLIIFEKENGQRDIIKIKL